MNKVKCTNGHFFDADKFSNCPICGSSMAGKSEPQKPGVLTPPSRKSRLDEVDKTERLEENDPVSTPPDTGKANGFNWHFLSKNPPSPKPPKQDPPPQPKPISTTPKPNPVPPSVQPEPVPESPANDAPLPDSLTQAVAATGYNKTSALPKTVAYYELAEENIEPPTAWLVCTKGVYQGHAFACKSGRNRIGRNPNCNINLINDNSIAREAHAIILYDHKHRVFYLQNGSSDGIVYLNDSPLLAHEQLNAYDQIEIGKAEFVFLPLCGERFAWEDHIS